MIQEVAAGLREELGPDKLALTLEELGLAPAASLTVQVRRDEMSAPWQFTHRVIHPVPIEGQHLSSCILLQARYPPAP